MTEFREVLDRYGVIDQSLGDAFQKIDTAVRKSIDEIATFERKLNEEFGLALNRLEAVIAQTAPLFPGATSSLQWRSQFRATSVWRTKASPSSRQ